MKKKTPDQTPRPPDAAELRRQAEERLTGRRTEDGGPRTDVETARLMHELQVHQIELEMQNEELCRAQNELRTAQEHSTELYDFAPAGYATLDREGAIRQVNLAGARMLGIERSRLANRRLGLFVAKDDLRAFNLFLQEVFASDTQASCEVTCIREGLQPVALRIEGARVTGGQECNAILLDITERRRFEQQSRANQIETEKLLMQAERSRRAMLSALEDRKHAEKILKRSEQLFRTDFENAPVGRCLVTVEGRFSKVNTAFCSMLGYSENELSGLTFIEVTHPEDRLASRNGVAQLLAGTTDQLNLEKRYVRKGGGIVWGSVRAALMRDAEDSPLHFSVHIQDITAQKQAQEALQKSEQQYRLLVETATEGIWIIDDQHVTTYVNHAMAGMLGHDPADMIGKPVGKFCFTEDLPFHEERMSKRHAGEDEVYERRLKRRDGSQLWTLVSAKAFMENKTRFLGSFAMFTDITKRKEAEKALRDSEEKFSRAFRLSPDAINLNRLADGVYLDINDGFTATTGYTRDDVLGRSSAPGDLGIWVNPEDRKWLAEALKNREQVQGLETQFRCKDGRIITGLMSARVIQIKGEDCILSITRDITARKQMEELLRQSEEFNEAIFDSVLSHIAVLDCNGVITATNAPWRCFALENPTRTGEPALNTGIGSNYLEVCRQSIGEDAKTAYDGIQAMLQGRTTSFIMEYPCHSPLQQRWFSMVVTPLGRERRGVVISHTDVTLRRQIEMELSATETRMREAAEAGNVGLWEWNLHTNEVFFSTEWKRQIGYEDHEIPNDFIEWENRVHPEDRGQTVQKVRGFIEDQSSTHEVEFRFRHKDGSYRWILARASITTDEQGKPQRMHGSHMDITARKRTEDALRQSEERYRLVSENSSDVVWLYDMAARKFTYASPSIEKLRGYTVEEVQQQTMSEMMTAESYQMVEKEQRARLVAFAAGDESVRTQTHEIGQIRRDGTVVMTEVVTTLITDAERRVTHIQGSSRDITERKLAEDALRRSEEQYRALIETTHTGFSVLDTEGRIIDANLEYVRLTGHDNLEEIRGRSVVEWTAPHDLKRNDASVKKCAVQGTIRNLEIDYVNRKGEITPIEINAALVGKDDNARMLSLCRDVTERKRAETVLQESEEQFRATFELNSIGMAQANPKTGQWLRVNQKMCDITGYSANEMLQMAVSEITHPDDRQKDWEAFQQVVRGEAPSYRIEKRYVRKDGSIIWVRVNMTVIRTSDGQPLRTLASIEDITERKRAEKALLNSEHMQRTILNNIPDPAWMKDIGGRFMEVNQAWCHFLGLTRENAVGRSASELFPPETVARLHEQDRVVAESGQPQHVEESMTGKGGNVRLFETFKAPVVDSTGSFSGIIGIARDITDRKLAEESLVEAKALLQAALDQSLAGIAIAEAPGGKLRYMNRAGLLICSSAEAEAVTDTDAQQYISRWNILRLDGTPMDMEEVPLARAVLFGETCAKEFIIRRSEHEERIVLANAAPILNAEGKVTAGIVVFMDITERKQAQEALQRSEERYRALVQSAPVVIYSTDSNGLVLSLNPTFEKETGWDKTEWIGKPFAPLVHPEDVPKALGMLQKALRGDEPEPYELRVHHKRGGWLVGRFLSVILRTDGQTTGILGAALNITESKQAEIELERLNTELAQKNRELQNVLFAASHDLRSPLLNIQGFGKRLEDACEKLRNAMDKPGAGAAELEEVAPIVRNDIPKALGFIHSGVMRMDTLINGMLRLSRLGQVEMRTESLDMNKLVTGVAASMMIEIQSTGGTVNVISLPGCHGDAGLISQVFANLIENAIKYRDSARPIRVEVSGQIKDKDVVYCVADNGIGIAAADQEKIWDLFHRLHPAGTKGDGLGLNLVRRITDRHKGRVWVESKPGEGSRFFVALPAGISG